MAISILEISLVDWDGGWAQSDTGVVLLCKLRALGEEGPGLGQWFENGCGPRGEQHHYMYDLISLLFTL